MGDLDRVFNRFGALPNKVVLIDRNSSRNWRGLLTNMVAQRDGSGPWALKSWQFTVELDCAYNGLPLAESVAIRHLGAPELLPAIVTSTMMTANQTVELTLESAGRPTTFPEWVGTATTGRMWCALPPLQQTDSQRAAFAGRLNGPLAAKAQKFIDAYNAVPNTRISNKKENEDMPKPSGWTGEDDDRMQYLVRHQTIVNTPEGYAVARRYHPEPMLEVVLEGFTSTTLTPADRISAVSASEREAFILRQRTVRAETAENKARELLSTLNEVLGNEGGQLAVNELDEAVKKAIVELAALERARATAAVLRNMPPIPDAEDAAAPKDGS